MGTPCSIIAGSEVFDDRRVLLDERGAIAHLVVVSPSLPAAEYDADPFECQCPNRRMMLAATGSHHIVIGVRPTRKLDRMGGVFVERLPKESATRPTLLPRFCEISMAIARIRRT